MNKVRTYVLSLSLVLTQLLCQPLSGRITIPTVLVGDSGNTPDATGFGSVDYDYYIGTYEVTNAQYTAFLNAVAQSDPHGLYNTLMSGDHGGIVRSGENGSYRYSTIDGREHMPVSIVTFWNAVRFVNWLSTGDTETGVYILGGITNPANSTIIRDPAAWALGGVAVTSENEWYKAAYYSGSPTGANGGPYWNCPTQTNEVDPFIANYGWGSPGKTPVGTYSAYPSHYGTFDQGGNVWELNDTIQSLDFRGIRGAAFTDFEDFSLHSAVSYEYSPDYEAVGVGFRVSSLEPIPEPAAYVTVFSAMVLFAALSRRYRSQAGASRGRLSRYTNV